jgi:hypothetical protein
MDTSSCYRLIYFVSALLPWVPLSSKERLKNALFYDTVNFDKRLVISLKRNHFVEKCELRKTHFTVGQRVIRTRELSYVNS